MNILLLTPYFIPYYRFGGPTTRTYQISKRLVEMGHNVTVLTVELDGFKRVREEDAADVTVKRYPVLFGIRDYLFTPQMIGYALDVAKDYDVIHGGGYRTFQSDLAVLASVIAHRPCIISAYGSIPYDLPSEFPSVFLKRLHDSVMQEYTIKNCDLFVAASRKEVCDLKVFGVPCHKIRLIPSGVALHEFDEANPRRFREKYNLHEKKVLLFVGRLHPVKGLDMLLYAFAQVLRESSDVCLVIIGNDSYGYSKGLMSLMQDLKITRNVIFVTDPARRELIDAYKAADIFILPSRYESCPLVIFEAGACKKPVIATRVGGIPEIIENGENGFLVEFGNVHQMKSAIQKLLKDNDLANRFGLELYKLVEEEHNWDSIAKMKEQMYQEMKM